MAPFKFMFGKVQKDVDAGWGVNPNVEVPSLFTPQPLSVSFCTFLNMRGRCTVGSARRVSYWYIARGRNTHKKPLASAIHCGKRAGSCVIFNVPANSVAWFVIATEAKSGKVPWTKDRESKKNFIWARAFRWRGGGWEGGSHLALVVFTALWQNCKCEWNYQKRRWVRLISNRFQFVRIFLWCPCAQSAALWTKQGL